MIKKLLVPTAGPKPAKDKAQYIIEMAHALGVEEVEVIHILDLGEFDDGRDALNIFVEMGKKYGVKINTYMQEGNVVPIIVDFIQDLKPDLIVMGASEGQIIANWIVAQVLEETRVPIVVIPYGIHLDNLHLK